MFLTSEVSHAHSARSREIKATIQEIRPNTKTLIVSSEKGSPLREFIWRKSTRFIQNDHFVDALALREGLSVRAYYRSPFIGKPFLTKIVWHSGGHGTPNRELK